jgi:hypothetical protein
MDGITGLTDDGIDYAWFQDKLAKRQEQDALRKQALEAELKSRLENETAHIDWTPLAAQLEAMGGGPVTAAAKAYSGQAAADTTAIEGLKEKILKPEDIGDLEKLSLQLGVKAKENEKARAARAEEKEDDREAAEARARIMAGTKASAAEDKGVDAVSREYAKEYNNYVTEGGARTIETNMNLLEEAKQDLAKIKSDSARPAGFLGEKGQAIFDPQLVAIREKIEKAVQGTLKPILGAQFAMVEGQQIMKRAFNPALSTAENMKRVEQEIKSLRSMAEAKNAAARHYETNNFSLKGFRGVGQSSPQASTPPPSSGGLKGSIKDRINKLKGN